MKGNEELEPREGFVLYRSFYDAIKNLSPEQFKECATAIIEYGLDEIEPTSDEPLVQIVFSLTKPQIDANNRRRENAKKSKARVIGEREMARRDVLFTPLPNVAKSSKSEQNVANDSNGYQEQPKEKDKEKEKDKDKDKVKEKDNGVLGEEEETLPPWERPITLTRQVGDLTKGLMRKTSL